MEGGVGVMNNCQPICLQLSAGLLASPWLENANLKNIQFSQKRGQSNQVQLILVDSWSWCLLFCILLFSLTKPSGIEKNVDGINQGFARFLQTFGGFLIKYQINPRFNFKLNKTIRDGCCSTSFKFLREIRPSSKNGIYIKKNSQMYKFLPKPLSIIFSKNLLWYSPKPKMSKNKKNSKNI